MDFRPLVVVLALITALVINVALLAAEEPPAEPPSTLRDRTSQVAQLNWRAAARQNNLRVMGLDDDLVDGAMRRMSALDEQRDRFLGLLKQDTATAGKAFCDPELPPPYAALGVLLVQKETARVPIEPVMLVDLTNEPFFAPRTMAVLHQRFEFDRSGATVLAVSSVLTMREAEALDGLGPFRPGATGGLGALEAAHPALRDQLAGYFALVHVLTELAREEATGICRSRDD